MKSVQQSTSSYVNKLGSSEIQFEKKTVCVQYIINPMKMRNDDTVIFSSIYQSFDFNIRVIGYESP